jgi:hypothetical protein
MNVPRAAALFAGIACLLAAAAGASEAGEAPRCALPKGARTLTTNTSAVVYRKGEESFGCVLKSGRRTRIATRFQDDLVIHRLVLAGTMLAYGSTEVMEALAGDETWLRVFNLKTGKLLASISIEEDQTFVKARMTDLELRRNGAVALIMDDTTDGRYVAKAGPEPYELTILDRGETIVPDSLAISGSLMFWQNGASAKSAPLP